MLPSQIIFLTVVVLTVASGVTATAIVTFGDTRKNIGQRKVAEKFAQITLIGAGAIIALAKLPE